MSERVYGQISQLLRRRESVTMYLCIRVNETRNKRIYMCIYMCACLVLDHLKLTSPVYFA